MGDRMAAPLGWTRVGEAELGQLSVQDLTAVPLDEGGLLLTDGEYEVLLVDEVGAPGDAARALRAVAEVLVERARVLDGRDPSRPKGWT